MEIFLQADTWVALLTLTFMEIVLGIDNIIFISLVAGKLPKHQQKKARIGGLTLAMLTRVLLLLGITWIIGLTKKKLLLYLFYLLLLAQVCFIILPLKNYYPKKIGAFI